MKRLIIFSALLSRESNSLSFGLKLEILFVLTIESINKNISILLHLKNIPILGICFGFQIMAASYGGKINSMKREDQGIFQVKLNKDSLIMKDIKKEFS